MLFTIQIPANFIFANFSQLAWCVLVTPFKTPLLRTCLKRIGQRVQTYDTRCNIIEISDVKHALGTHQIRERYLSKCNPINEILLPLIIKPTEVNQNPTIANS